MNKWYEKNGKDGDVVISTRIRLARNLKNYPFTNKLSVDGRNKVAKLISDAMINGNSAIANRFMKLEIEKLEEPELLSLVEKHLVSPDFIRKAPGKYLLLIDDESISIMINEEDHIRLQVMKEGLELDSSYKTADQIDTLLDECLSFAFDEQLGYLTQCPTNLGTGMRASLLLHLPALEESGTIHPISTSLSKLGLTLRGTYGEGTKATGALYQLSNQVTLGLSEQEALRNLKNISMKLIAQERELRESMGKRIEIQDMIGRSLGILYHAQLLKSEEFMNLLSMVRLGISIGQVKDISYDTINALTVNAQPAMLIRQEGHILTAGERDQKRAELVKRCLKG